jgi:hypothetical protein
VISNGKSENMTVWREKSIVLLESFQASPSRRVKVKTLGWLEAVP